MGRAPLKDRRNLTVSFPNETLKKVERIAKRWMVDKSDVIRIAVGELVASSGGSVKALPIIEVDEATRRELLASLKEPRPNLTLEALFHR